MATTAANTAIRFLWAVDAREVIARRIRERRKELGLTQQQVAERGNLAMRSYQRYEKGTVMPRKPARGRLTTALELTPGELEPPVDEDHDDDTSTADQLREVLTRLARIEGLLGPTPPDELAARIAELEAARTREQNRAVGTKSRGVRPGKRGR